MKAYRIAALALAGMMALTGLAQAQGPGGRGQGKGNGPGRGMGQTALANLPVEDLNDFEKESLLLMREEEKLARDVYLELGKTYDLPVFSNIPRSEQRHLDQMGLLLERYGLEDPMLKESGQFTSPELQKLYQTLVAEGQKSEVAALKVGATIEDLDIYDLERALEGQVDNQDITMVYRNLAKGSRNHLRAFMAQLKTHEATYEAQYIDQADLDAIVASEWERGPADGQKGRGRGRGQQRGK